MIQSGLNCSVAIPAHREQRRIAEILSTLDEAIEQTEALIAKHQQIKAGLMHDLFTRGVTPDGHLRPTRDASAGTLQRIPAWVDSEGMGSEIARNLATEFNLVDPPT